MCIPWPFTPRWLYNPYYKDSHGFKLCISFLTEHSASEFYLFWLAEQQGWGHFYGRLLTVLRLDNVMAGQRLYNMLCSAPVLDSIILQIVDVRNSVVFFCSASLWVRRVIPAPGMFHSGAVLQSTGCPHHTLLAKHVFNGTPRTGSYFMETL